MLAWPALRSPLTGRHLWQGTALGFPNSSSRNRLWRSHWPHQEGREQADPSPASSWSGDSRADSTAYGLRTPTSQEVDTEGACLVSYLAVTCRVLRGR
jgi:hypothetical protein